VTQDFSPLAGTLAAGDQIAGYQIGEQIGTGGMAVVYRALDLRLDRQVALKVLSPRLAEDDAFRQRFIRESRAAAGVDHPHIIPVFEAGNADGVLFIAMRYVSGGDVRSLIQAEGTLSTARASAIASQAAAALDAAHRHGLVHRDVKPGNILLDSAGGRDHVYLADFGLSKYAVGANTLTGTGQFMGTLDYVSPEQIQGHRADGRADQYALACTVVEMLCGTPPYKRDESMALLWAQLEAPPPALTELRADLPPALNPVISTALAKSPNDRYQTCLDFATALAQACLPAPVTLREPTEQAAVFRPDPADAPGPVQAAGKTQPPAARPGWAAQTRPEALLAVPAAEETAAASPRAPGSVLPPGLGAARPPGAGAGRVAPAWERAESAAAPPRSAAPSPRPGGLAGGDRQPPGWGAQPPPNSRSPARDPHLVPARPRPRRIGRRIAAAVLGLAVVAALAFAGYKVLTQPKQTSSLPPPKVTKTVTSPPPVTTALSPGGTVQAYFAAINAKDYQRAWQLNTVVHHKQNFQQFQQGYAGTAEDTVRIESTNGAVVTAQLIATQTNKTVKTFEGTYTVTDGVITATSVHQVS